MIYLGLNGCTRGYEKWGIKGIKSKFVDNGSGVKYI